MQSFNAFIHLTALLANVTTPLLWFIKLGIALLIAVDFWFTYRRFNKENRRITYSENLRWQIIENGTIKNIHILPSTVITPWLIFLHIQGASPLLIAKDSLEHDNFRHLLVKLKMTSTSHD